MVVTCVPSDSQDLLPYESTSALILTSDFCVLHAKKLLSDNTIYHGMKSYTPEKKGLFAAGIC